VVVGVYPDSRIPRPWPWMNAPSCGRDVAPHGRKVRYHGLALHHDGTGLARGAPSSKDQNEGWI